MWVWVGEGEAETLAGEKDLVRKRLVFHFYFEVITNTKLTKRVYNSDPYSATCIVCCIGFVIIFTHTYTLFSVPSEGRLHTS